MSTTTTNNTTTGTSTQLFLDPIADEPSTAKVEQVVEDKDFTVYAKAELKVFVAGESDDQSIYVDLKMSTYANVGRGPGLHTFTGIMNHRFTREEAEALVAVLSHELAKL